MVSELLTVGEVASRLRVQRFTIYTWVSQKRIPYIKVGRRVVFNWEKIEKWLEENSSEPKEF